MLFRPGAPRAGPKPSCGRHGDQTPRDLEQAGVMPIFSPCRMPSVPGMSICPRVMTGPEPVRRTEPLP